MVKLVEENRGEKLLGIGLGNNFLNDNQSARNKTKINRWHCIKSQSFCKAKDPSTK